MDDASNGLGPLQAHVVLKREAENTPAVRVTPPSPEVREAARQELENLGFTIVRVSPLSILIEASPEKFEDVFHAQTQRHSAPGKSWPHSYISWKQGPQIPIDLQKTVQDIVLPEPAQLH